MEKENKKIPISKTAIVFLILVLISFVGISNVSAEEKSVVVDVIIEPRGVPYEELVVGDSFSYRIILQNNGEELINSSFNVEIYSPEGELIAWSEDIYPAVINPGESRELFPKHPTRGDRIKVFSFEKDGVYTLKIKSEEDLDFIKKDTSLFFPMEFPYYFDVMPRWEKRLKDRNEEINKQMVVYQKNTMVLSVIMAAFILIQLISFPHSRKVIVEIIRFFLIFIFVTFISFLVISFISQFF